MVQDSSPTHWYVLYTKSRNEKAVAVRLQEIGLEVYCPVKRIRRRWSDRWKWVEEPLFSSYCFVHLAEEQRDEVFRVPGVVRYLFWLGKPAVVRNQEIEQIKTWLNDFDHEQIEVLSFQPGERVAIASGPLMHQGGEVVKQQGNYLYLKLEGLGLLLRVDLAENKVELRKH